MPTYDYKCTKCEEMFEVFHKISDEPLKTCSVCGGELVRLISGGLGVIFKGNGFYTTDYKKASTAGPGKRDGDGEKETGGSGREAPAAKAEDSGSPSAGNKEPSKPGKTPEKK
jgi:putative FmdB family regulatory protein